MLAVELCMLSSGVESVALRHEHKLQVHIAISTHLPIQHPNFEVSAMVIAGARTRKDKPNLSWSYLLSISHETSCEDNTAPTRFSCVDVNMICDAQVARSTRGSWQARIARFSNDSFFSGRTHASARRKGNVQRTNNSETKMRVVEGPTIQSMCPGRRTHA